MSVQQLSQSLGVEVVEKISPASNAVLVRKSSLERENFAIQSLEAHPMVENAEPNYILVSIKMWTPCLTIQC